MAENEQGFGVEQQAFEVLEKEFQEVLNELSSDHSLEKFRLEYEKLHRALKVSHENEKRLLQKCREISGDIQNQATKVSVALKMTQEDNQTIQFLKNELDRIYKILQMSKEREEKSKLKIENLHSEINHLNQLIQRGATSNTGPTTTVHDLLIAREELTKEKEMLQMMILNVSDDLKNISEKSERAIVDKEECFANYDSIIKKKEELEQRTLLDDEKKKKVQEELESIKRDYDQSKKSIEVLLQEKEKLEKEKQKLYVQINEKEKKNNELIKEQKTFEKNEHMFQEKLKDLEKFVGDLNDILIILQQDQKDLDIERIQNEDTLQDLQNKEESLSNECTEIKEKIAIADKLREITLLGINQLENDINEEKRLAFDDRGVLEDMRRNRDILQKDLNRAETNNKKQNEELIQKIKILKEKENELSGLNKSIDRLNQQIKILEKEKEKYGLAYSKANAQYFHSLEEIKLKDNLISEFQKKNIETEAKLKQQQNLYEAVRSDRNLYSKNLTDTQEEIQEIKKRYKMVNHQISQLKEEIDAKETALAKEHIEHKKKDKTIEEQLKIMDRYKKDLKEKEEKIKTYTAEVAKLHFMIKESEQQRQKLKEEYELVVAERDILGTQLIRRNAEAALLYEKIKINQSTLKKGEIQYTERLGDIIILKSQIADLINEIKVFKGQANSIGDMKNEIHNLSKELIQERLKVKSLSEELENPMNVHRWRKLEATDSETYELMTKIQSLQKRLIQKTEEVVKKEEIAQSKETQLRELRDIMKRQPGIEEEKMIPIYQESLKQKTKQMRAMNGELIMYQSHLSEYKLEIDRLTKELQDNKKKYFEQKKREQQRQEIQNIQQKAMAIQINLPDKRFTGGGFNLAIYN